MASSRLAQLVEISCVLLSLLHLSLAEQQPASIFRSSQTLLDFDRGSALPDTVSEYEDSAPFDKDWIRSLGFRDAPKTSQTLFDVSKDPFETRNMINSGNYIARRNATLDRLSYWLTIKSSPFIPDSKEKVSSFIDSESIGPWLDSSDDSQLSLAAITPEYANSNSPHIVFLIVDDWGYNDVNWNTKRSPYISWASPFMTKYKNQGVSLTSYFTHPLSIPSRSAVMTGRYPLRTGMGDVYSESATDSSMPELPSEESTIAQELQRCGYRSYYIGKWGLGMSSAKQTPTYRGFNYFYGHLSGDSTIDPYTKKTEDGWLDLYEDDKLVTDANELSSDMHLGYLLQNKVNSAISNHAMNFNSTPMFLMYSISLMANVNGQYSSPSEYLAHCSEPSVDDVPDDEVRSALYNYCGLAVMLDDIVRNTSCLLSSKRMSNTLFVVVSANGGEPTYIPGTNYVFRGGKGDTYLGGIASNAFIHYSSSNTTVGLQYSPTMHVTDWFPTLLSVASNGAWKSPLNGFEIDGVDTWANMMILGNTSLHSEIVHSINDIAYSIQLDGVKYDSTSELKNVTKVAYVFENDLLSYDRTVCKKTATVIIHEVDESITHHVYDLSTDPYEADNLYNTWIASDSKALEIADYSKRVQYWQNLVRAPDIPDSPSKNKVWNKNGGISPYLDDTVSPDDLYLNVPQLYEYEAAPHIVFVLVDDWGWNDLGMRSTYLNWTTPTINRLGEEGILLTNYYSASTCVPARGSLMTGRYSIRIGLWQSGEGAELPLSEVTLAQELKSAGYRTYMVGKWHLGFSTNYHLPSNRGFDSFYGYYNGFVDYWSKLYGSHLDLQTGASVVKASEEIDSALHNGHLMQSKAELAIKEHATEHENEPMFLYYAMQLIHGVWSAPQVYLDRCGAVETTESIDEYLGDVLVNYCALNAMLDEAVTNLTCALEAYGMSDNTVLLIVSDNGGESTVPGNNYPYRGSKGSTSRGGVSTTAMIHSALVPKHMRGKTYDGLMHVTDWLPTLMSVATGGAWSGSLASAELDGVDMWDAILSNAASPRNEIVHYADGNGTATIQWGHIKYQEETVVPGYSNPVYTFSADKAPDTRSTTCESPSLMTYVLDDDDEAHAGLIQNMARTLREAFRIVVLLMATMLILWTALVAVAVVKSMAYRMGRKSWLKGSKMGSEDGVAGEATGLLAAKDSTLYSWPADSESMFVAASPVENDALSARASV